MSRPKSPPVQLICCVCSLPFTASRWQKANSSKECYCPTHHSVQRARSLQSMAKANSAYISKRKQKRNSDTDSASKFDALQADARKALGLKQ